MDIGPAHTDDRSDFAIGGGSGPSDAGLVSDYSRPYEGNDGPRDAATQPQQAEAPPTSTPRMATAGRLSHATVTRRLVPTIVMEEIITGRGSNIGSLLKDIERLEAKLRDHLSGLSWNRPEDEPKIGPVQKLEHEGLAVHAVTVTHVEYDGGQPTAEHGLAGHISEPPPR